MCPPKNNRFECHLNSQPLPLILVKKNIICDTFLHGSVVIIDNFFQILMDDALGNISLEDGKIWNLFLVRFDLIESCDVIDDRINPDSFDIGDMI